MKFTSQRTHFIGHIALIYCAHRTDLCFGGGFVHLPDHDCLVGGAREEEGVVVGEVEGAHVVSVAGQGALHHAACVNED